jgi:hypothetical protein
MYFILEFIFYIVFYGLLIYGLHMGYLYIRDNYTQSIVIDQQTKNKKYDEILNHLKEVETTHQENILSMDNELSDLLNDELQEE